MSCELVCRKTNLKNTDGTIIEVEGRDIISQLIGTGLSDRPSSPVRTKVESCKSCDCYGCRFMDHSVTMIPSSSTTGCHPRQTNDGEDTLNINKTLKLKRKRKEFGRVTQKSVHIDNIRVSQMFCCILVSANLQWLYDVTESIQVVIVCCYVW